MLKTLIAIAALTFVPVAEQEPSANDLMTKVGAYAASYGEKASVVVATETYTQIFSIEGHSDMPRPMKLVAEFAIVKLKGGGWAGFRDVMEVNGKPVRDRKDRLMSLLTSESASLSEAGRIANESSRFNIGPISRNFNTPTAALFFFLPASLGRFTFTKKGNVTIEGIKTIEIAYKETTLPTFVTTSSGRNVPLEGSLWVTHDGTVIRTSMHMEKFADIHGGHSADIEVTYKKPADIDLWLPSQMVELYLGVVTAINIRPASGRTVTRATYSNFKQFGASGKIVPQ